MVTVSLGVSLLDEGVDPVLLDEGVEEVLLDEGVETVLLLDPASTAVAGNEESDPTKKNACKKTGRWLLVMWLAIIITGQWSRPKSSYSTTGD